jgi:glycosyltransferase involved in cell wall biosynthesis
MKVAYINQPFEYISHQFQGSSIWIQTFQVMRALTGRPVDFLVYAPLFAEQPATETYDNLHYRRFSTRLDETLAKPVRFLEKIAGYPQPKKPFYASRWHYGAYIHQIAKDLRSQRVDIVTIFNYSQFAPIIRAHNPDVRIILHMTCDWLGQLDPGTIDRRLESVDLVLGCSHHVTNLVVNRFPHHAHKSKTLYNGVSLEAFSRQDEHPTTQNKGQEKRLLFVGRISPEKGLHTLLQAFEIVAQQDPDVQLDIVGSPGSAPYEFMVLVSDDPLVNALSRFYQGRFKRSDYFQQLQNLLSPTARARVNFAGSFPHHEVVQYYQQADILINPSLTEAFGISLVEAMASKIPAIVTNVGGMVEIVGDGVTGRIVPPENPSELANATLDLLASQSERQAMGVAGYQRVANTFTWQHISDQLWDYYQNL